VAFERDVVPEYFVPLVLDSAVCEVKESAVVFQEAGLETCVPLTGEPGLCAFAFDEVPGSRVGDSET